MLSDENDVLEALCVFTLEKKFWDELHELHKNNTEDDMKNRLIKLNIYLEKRFLVYLEQYSNYKRVKNITLTFPLQATTTWQEN